LRSAKKHNQWVQGCKKQGQPLAHWLTRKKARPTPCSNPLLNPLLLLAGLLGGKRGVFVARVFWGQMVMWRKAGDRFCVGKKA
jgi:hypothetical protein